MNNNLISREALKAKMFDIPKPKEDATFWDGVDAVGDLIDKAPLVPLPDFKAGYKQAIIDGKTNYSRPQGEWIETSDFDEFYGKVYKCTNCNEETLGCDCRNYCPNCGADMRGGVE